MTGPQIPVFDVRVEPEDLAAVELTLRSGRLREGPRTEEFERAFAEYLGCDHVVAVSSCTAALHIACVAAGIGPGDEVIVPSITFAATANAVRYCGARPVFADVRGSDGDLNVDVDSIEAAIGDRTAAVMPVHFAGYPVEIERLVALCGDRGLVVIEDAAQAVCTRVDGRAAGTFGLAGCFSFFPNKVLGVGEGGALCTNSTEVAERARRLRSWGMMAPAAATGAAPEPADVVELGFNYRFDDLRASLLTSRFARLEREVARRRELVARYRDLFAEMDGVEIGFAAQDLATSSCYLMAVLIDPDSRSGVRQRLRDAGIQTTATPPSTSSRRTSRPSGR